MRHLIIKSITACLFQIIFIFWSSISQKNITVLKKGKKEKNICYDILGKIMLYCLRNPRLQTVNNIVRWRICRNTKT